MTGIVERTCRNCNAAFSIGPEAIQFFQRRGLSLPWRCGDCRDARRRDRGDRVVGTVIRVVPGKHAILDVEGERIIAFDQTVNATDLPLRPGDRVSLWIIDGHPLRRADNVFRE